MESRTQGSRPGPRTQKNPRPRTALPRTDPLEAKTEMLEAKAKDQGHSRKCSPMNVLKCVYFAFVHSHLQYGLLIWSATYKTHLSKLQRMQNKAVKIASGSGWSEKAEPYYLNLHVLKLHKLKQFQICKFMYQFTHKQLPTKFDDYFQEISLVSIRETRNSNKFKQYYMPRYKTSRLQNSIKFSGVKA